MEFAVNFAGMWVSAIVGLGVGAWLANRRWRLVGDHPYMNRMESCGKLYHVRRETAA